MVDRADQSALEERWACAVATGDFRAARAMLDELRSAVGDVRARGFTLELDAARWLAGRPDASLPTVETVAALVEQATTDALARASGYCVRAAVLAFDSRVVDAHRAVLEALAARSSSGAEPNVRAKVARTWSSLLRGDRDVAGAAAVEASRSARAAGVGAAVAEVQVAQALIALGDGDIAAATAAARRAVRMARSEGAPQDELFANLVLARVRRASGAPYLATRILVALRDLASAPFRPWVDYELWLAGGAERELEGEAARAAGGLARALGGGDAPGVESARASLLSSTHGYADVQAEARDLLVAVGASGGEGASAAMVAWARGDTHAVPHGLHAFGTAPDDDAAPVVAWAIVPAGGRDRGHRILTVGRRLASMPRAGLLPVVIEPGRRPQERTDAAIALLALRGEAMDGERFFQELYGFAFKPSLHVSVMSTLVHRMRATLGDAATLHRDHDALRLEPHVPLVVWDPRCQRPLEDRILSVLTRGGPSTAKRAADRLGVPLRTVQAALGQLVDGGACKRDRQGRAVEYVVEDTTFSEPTVTRARAWREATRAGQE